MQAELGVRADKTPCFSLILATSTAALLVNESGSCKVLVARALCALYQERSGHQVGSRQVAQRAQVLHHPGRARSDAHPVTRMAWHDLPRPLAPAAVAAGP